MATATKSKDKTTVKLQPIGDRLVVKREESEGKTAGGIVLPDSAKDKPTRGVVVSVGDGRLLENGARGAMQVKAGDRVLFGKYAGTEIKIDDDEHVILREDEVLGILE